MTPNFQKMPSRVYRASVAGALLLGLLLALPVRAKNIILMVGEGMGPDTVAAAGAYQFGKDYFRSGGAQRLSLETLANHAYVTTNSFEGAPYDFTWNDGYLTYPTHNATDAAAAATAMACGVKTCKGYVGVTADKTPVPTIFELAQLHRMKTGLVTTVPFSYATPAAFAAHSSNGADAPGLAHQILWDARPDVVMGAGTPSDPMATQDKKAYEFLSKEDWSALLCKTTPYRLASTRAQFRQLIITPVSGKVLGLFSRHNSMTCRRADGSTAEHTLPTLAEMTRAALTQLDNPHGFVLVVTSGTINICNHANFLDGAVGETLGFDQAVAAVRAWVQKHGGWEQNLLMVTANHETGYLHDVRATGAGKLPQVTWGLKQPWTEHTNRLVDLYYQGWTSSTLTGMARTAHDFEHGPIVYLDNTDIFRGMTSALRIASPRILPPTKSR